MYTKNTNSHKYKLVFVLMFVEFVNLIPLDPTKQIKSRLVNERKGENMRELNKMSMRYYIYFLSFIGVNAVKFAESIDLIIACSYIVLCRSSVDKDNDLMT